MTSPQAFVIVMTVAGSGQEDDLTRVSRPNSEPALASPTVKARHPRSAPSPRGLGKHSVPPVPYFQRTALLNQAAGSCCPAWAPAAGHLHGAK